MLPGLNSYNLCLLLNTRKKTIYRLMGYKYEPPRTSQNEGFVGVPREWPQMQVTRPVSSIAPPFIQPRHGTARSPLYPTEVPSSAKRSQGRGQPCRSNPGRPHGLTPLATRPQDRILDLANTCPFDLKKPGTQRYVYKYTGRNLSNCFSAQPRQRRS